ncbi:MAG: hypothetical protein MSC31_16690 [Solirubrobacteraceae bacterium MAG38_C4-C5]|nr:hypothetical protein [Candidatus Siliceabacter maunaloa]
MTARAAWVVVAAALGSALAAGAPAAGQAPAASEGGEPRPVTGSAGFNQAPVLEPGSYGDTILPGESLYYAVRLGPGQQMRVQIAIDLVVGEGSEGAPLTAGAGILNANAYSPMRQRLSQGLGVENDQLTAELRTEPVVPFDQAVGESGSSSSYTGPGTYYAGIDVGEQLVGQEQFIELPVTLTVEVTGGPPVDPSQVVDPTRVVARRDADDGKDASGEPGTGAEGSDGPSLAVLAGGGLGGLAAGAVLGAVAVRRRRSRAGEDASRHM